MKFFLLSEKLGIYDLNDVFSKLKVVTKSSEEYGYIYIATTKDYNQKNIFKIGSTVNLTKRLCSYNTGRLTEDKYYYLWDLRCTLWSDLEKHIHRLLTPLKEGNELYCLNYESLKKLIEHICFVWIELGV